MLGEDDEGLPPRRVRDGFIMGLTLVGAGHGAFTLVCPRSAGNQENWVLARRHTPHARHLI